MNLIADIGNTYSKFAIFQGEKLIKKIQIKNLKHIDLNKSAKEFKKKYPQLKNCIFSSVRKDIEYIDKSIFETALFFDENTAIPIKNNYKTPKTLGKDRLAAVVAASYIFSGENVLVFDAGTALTVDFISKDKEYYGGSIAPGINMRFKALNSFTSKLPEIEQNISFNEIIGVDTETSILSGVQNGILYEVEGHIRKFSEKYSDLKVTFTGGDTFFFERKIKNTIFAEPNLVLIGLNLILNYNAK